MARPTNQRKFSAEGATRWFPDPRWPWIGGLGYERAEEGEEKREEEERRKRGGERKKEKQREEVEDDREEKKGVREGEGGGREEEGRSSIHRVCQFSALSSRLDRKQRQISWADSAGGQCGQIAQAPGVP
eukprot:1360205-Rhodomonas_salina.2